MHILLRAALAGSLVLGSSLSCAAPVFLQGITEDSLKNIGGLNQPGPTFCVPTVGYMMALYEERHGTDLLDLLAEADSAIGVQRVSKLMKTDQDGKGTSIQAAAEAMRLIYMGVLNGRVFPSYDKAWSQLRDNADGDPDNDWQWRDIPARIDQNLPIMLTVSALNADEVGHAVFVFGYDIVEGGDEVWAYLFDPFASMAGRDTSRQAKKWSIHRTTLEIGTAIDVLDGTEHLDTVGHAYEGRTLESMVTAAATSVPEPDSGWLLSAAAAAAAALRLVRRPSAEEPRQELQAAP